MLLNSACRVSGLLGWHGPPHVDGIDRTADRRSHTIDRPGRFTAAVRSCSVRSSARHFIGRRPSFSRSSSAQWTRLASGLHRCPWTTATRLRASAFGA